MNFFMLPTIICTKGEIYKVDNQNLLASKGVYRYWSIISEVQAHDRSISIVGVEAFPEKVAN